MAGVEKGTPAKGLRHNLNRSHRWRMEGGTLACAFSGILKSRRVHETCVEVICSQSCSVLVHMDTSRKVHVPFESLI